MAERICRSFQGQARMHEHVGGRKLALRLVMVRDDQLQAEPARLLGLGNAADAAIDRDDHLNAVVRELLQRFAVEAIALFEPVRYVVLDARAQQLKEIEENS